LVGSVRALGQRGEPAASAPASAWSASLPASAPGRIEPALLKQVLDSAPGGQVPLIAELREQADLSSVPSGSSSPEQVGSVVALLKTTASRSQAELLAFLQAQQQAGHASQVHSLWVFNAIALQADATTVWELAARPEVRILREDRWRKWLEPVHSDQAPSQVEPGTLVQWNVARIRADRAWSALGLDGTGVTVAIMDTGADWQHPALLQRYRGYKPGGLVIHEGNWICTTDEGYLYPVDGNGHGTHVTGTAVGGEDSDAVAIGVAPGARWIAAKMLNDQGYGYDSWIHAAFEWILAPAGDPSLAPDVVNGSWGSADDSDEAFRPDLQALRAAGILAVFAAGNYGPAPATLNSPGSYPETIAVGAVDEVDTVAYFSSRGPSPWGEVKPELSAPGTQIRSTLPGGTYGLLTGTSMAVPHVSGLIALVLQADPGLSVDQVEGIVAGTAQPLGDPVPNNDTGWGRIDAYQAAAVASGAGFLAGTISRMPDGLPLPDAAVRAFDHVGEPRAVVTSGQDGKYRMALPPGLYDLEVQAFGYLGQAWDGVQVQAGLTVTLDASLAPLPTGELTGVVRDGASGEPLAAGVSILGTPAHATSNPATGEYSLDLPAGVYAIAVARNGYRRHLTGSIEIVAGQVTRSDVDLVGAPTLLLVDSGPWYYGSQADYLEQALDDRAFVYDTWTIRRLPEDVPALEDLAAYDVTVWSSPLDAPGLIGAGDVISNYLASGGNLLLTGQDIGYWDGGLDFVYAEYYTRFLHARAAADDAGREDVVGLPGDLLDGLLLPLNGPDSARNQYSPDAIEILDEREAALVADYAGGWHAALRASGCQSYRALYFAAGLEGLGDRSSRAEVLNRALDWLGGPRPALSPELSPPSQEQIWLGQPAITYTVELRNTGDTASRFALELSDSLWPSSVWDEVFSQPLTESLTLGACQTQTLGIEVVVPAGVQWNTSDTFTLTARSLLDPEAQAHVRFRSKAPAPVLLVDDHRWYGQLDRYEEALEASGVPYDLWRIDPVPTPDTHSPPLQRMQRYRSVIWFTSYDWYATLTRGDEERLAAYLDGGGRLLLSSQDYLYTSGFTAFARDYLGVVGYTESLSATQVTGAEASPVARGLGPFSLLYAFPNWSDSLRISPGTRVAYWGQHGQPAALTLAHDAWKTAFFAFPMEAMQADDMPVSLGRVVRWLSPLGDSSMVASRGAVAAGEAITFTLQIRNTGPATLSGTWMSNPVPAHTSYAPGSLTGPAEYDPLAGCFTWSGALSAGQVVTVGYQLLLDADLPVGAMVENVAHLQEESGLQMDASAQLRVGTPDLSGSLMQVNLPSALPRQVLTYTLTLRNVGLSSAQATMTDATPPFAAYLPGSAWASTGVLTPTADALEWAGVVDVADPVTIRYAVSVDPGAAGRYIHNRAVVQDGWGAVHRIEQATWVESLLFLPLVVEER
jgi:uncharacterized repeat protein (TIGR01451 family)